MPSDELEPVDSDFPDEHAAIDPTPANKRVVVVSNNTRFNMGASLIEVPTPRR
jgi:hypothetical protein